MSAVASDERLVQRATKGDERAFSAIFDRYHRDLYRFCLAIVGSPEDAQDALQNAMVKVLRALPGEQRHIQLKPWLYRIAHNEAIEVLRRRRDNVELEPDLHASGAGPAESAAARERLRALLDDLAALPERQRAALVMRELGDLGFAEIGAAFETSEAVARQTIYEARLSLRQMEAGREMSCETVMRQLSDADGRVTRRREIKAHLRACASCSAFRDGIAERRRDFAAIAPLPLAASAALLQGVLGANGAGAVAGAGAVGGAGAMGAAGSAGGAAAGGTGGVAATSGLAGTVAAGAAKTAAGSAIVKSAATVAVVAAVGAGAADRGGLIETPLPLGNDGAKSSGPAQPGTTHAAPAAAPGQQKPESAPSKAQPNDPPRGKGTRAQDPVGFSDASRQARPKRPRPTPAASKEKAPGRKGGKVGTPGQHGAKKDASSKSRRSKERPPRKAQPSEGPKQGGGGRPTVRPSPPPDTPRPTGPPAGPGQQAHPLPSTGSGATGPAEIQIPPG